MNAIGVDSNQNQNAHAAWPILSSTRMPREREKEYVNVISDDLQTLLIE